MGLQVLEAFVESVDSVGFSLLIASALVALPAGLVQPVAILVVGPSDPAVDGFKTVRHVVRSAREPQLNVPNVHGPLHAHRGVLARLLLEKLEPFVSRLRRNRDAPVGPVASGGRTGSPDICEARRLK